MINPEIFIPGDYSIEIEFYDEENNQFNLLEEVDLNYNFHPKICKNILLLVKTTAYNRGCA